MFAKTRTKHDPDTCRLAPYLLYLKKKLKLAGCELEWAVATQTLEVSVLEVVQKIYQKIYFLSLQLVTIMSQKRSTNINEIKTGINGSWLASAALKTENGISWVTLMCNIGRSNRNSPRLLPLIVNNIHNKSSIFKLFAVILVLRGYAESCWLSNLRHMKL